MVEARFSLAGARPGCEMDSDLGTAVRVPELQTHHEPIARLAAPVAVVCGDGHRGSAVSAFDAERDGRRDRRKVRT